MAACLAVQTDSDVDVPRRKEPFEPLALWPLSADRIGRQGTGSASRAYPAEAAKFVDNRLQLTSS